MGATVAMACAWAAIAEGSRLADTFPSVAATDLIARPRGSVSRGAPPLLGHREKRPLRRRRHGSPLGWGQADDGGVRDWSLRLAATPRDESADAALAEVFVYSGFEFEGFPLKLPAAWANMLVPTSVKKVQERAHETIYVATLVQEFRPQVVIRVMGAAQPETQRELRLLHRVRFFQNLGLSQSGHTVQLVDARTVGETTFVMMEKAAIGKPLWQILRDHEVHWPGEEEHSWQTVFGMAEPKKSDDCGEGGECEKVKGPWAPEEGMPMPLEQSLPLLADVLRGARDLEESGIVHASFTPFAIAMDSDRALVRGLSSACLCHGGEQALRCDNFVDTWERSVGSIMGILWQAPEVVDGTPTGPENHVWAAGVIFAQMCFGYIPTMRAVLMNLHQRRSFPSGHVAPISLGFVEPEGRERLRETLRQKFAVEEDPSFRFLDPDVKRVLSGMLTKAVGARWSTARALYEVEALARAKGVELPAARTPPSLSLESQAPDIEPAISIELAADLLAAEGVYLQGHEDAWQ